MKPDNKPNRPLIIVATAIALGAGLSVLHQAGALQPVEFVIALFALIIWAMAYFGVAEGKRRR